MLALVAAADDMDDYAEYVAQTKNGKAERDAEMVALKVKCAGLERRLRKAELRVGQFERGVGR